MRIIAGEFRGRKLLSPESDTTRPITDRVKQSLFDILTPLIPDSVVYDCFAGTGSMGLECLSRGAAHATFFEADRSAVKRLQENIQAVKADNRSTVLSGDIFKHLARVPESDRRATLVFLDPPYRFLREKASDLTGLAENLAAKHLTTDAMIVFRHDSADMLPLPSLKKVDERTYGGMTLEFLQPNG